MRRPRAQQIIAVLPALLPLAIAAQAFQGTGAAIPDNGDTLNIPLAVAGLSGPLNSSAFGLEEICVTINHPWIGELAISLVAPDGTVVLLAEAQGGPNSQYGYTCFRQDATTLITQGIPPFSGTFRPQEDLGAINNGQDGNGTWYLRVLDMNPGANSGSVTTWDITFGNDPAVPLTFISSNLPIVVINTSGQDIPDDVKITANMGVVYNGPGAPNYPAPPYTDYDGLIGIEVRGNTSNSLSPKKSWDLELRDGLGEDLDAPLLGMPSESDWILLANYFDKSLMNNSLTFQLARAMGEYAPRTRDVEVVLNGEYMGVYTLVEKIKRNASRVDIAKLNPWEVSGDDVTGGYILRVDWFNGNANGFVSQYPPAVNTDGQVTYFEYRYPKSEDIVPEQRAYIQAYVDSFETALAGPDFMDTTIGYRAYVDVRSFVDMFLINELSRNVDGYRLSSYLYKDKASNGGKLHDGPAWDYDLAWGNASYCGATDSTGWQYLFGDICPEHQAQIPFWWARFMEDSSFVNAVSCRWNELRDNVLSPAYISAYCDSVASLIDTAQQRNFLKWPILGTYVWPNPYPIPATYAGEVQELKDFMNARWAWIDANLPGNCGFTASVSAPVAAIQAPFPNPFTDRIYFRTVGSGPVIVKIADALG
ncbi:MAG: CotH kinase family protein, partial [Bacteroidetes bacterium]|nr:CotH kinase family protein [Bacteroidota bacterium]